MKVVKVFIASSVVEFEETRIFIGDYIRKLNDSIRSLGRMVLLHLCEDEYRNSQAIYDRLIENSDIFIAIVGSKLGEFTLHEIVDVADKCPSLRKRQILLTRPESDKTIPHKLLSNFSYRRIDGGTINEIIDAISDLLEDTFQDIQDEQISFPTHNFFLSIPEGENIEIAVINNIIRRLRDQNNGIMINEGMVNGKEEAVIALLGRDNITEYARLQDVLSLDIASESLWLFANSELLDTICDTDILKLHDKLISQFGVYPSYFHTYRILSVLFENKLLRAILECKNESSNFIYEIEDHWLIRRNLENRKKHLFWNLIGITGDPKSERQIRKERIILNLLNQYWLNGRIDKHIDALTKLQMGDYDLFKYSVEDLDEVKARDYYQAADDYICDTIEYILSETYNEGFERTRGTIEEITRFIEENNRIFSIDQLAKYNLCIALAYSGSRNYLMQAVQYIKKTIENLASSDDEYKSIKALIKSLSLNLCADLSEVNDFKGLNQLSNLALSLSSPEDTEYYLPFKICLYCSLCNNPIEKEVIANEIDAIFHSDKAEMFSPQDNTQLKFWLIYERESIFSHVFNSVNDLYIYDIRLNQALLEYDKYLSCNPEYELLHSSLLSLKAYVTEDLQMLNDVVKVYNDERDEAKRGKQYYDILFCLAKLYTRHGQFSDALPIFQRLYELYGGIYDKAVCLQNLALCYMSGYVDVSCLKLAEFAYKLALDLFESIGDKSMCGNVNDGLSYCFILQRRFEDAKESAERAVNTQEYTALNKHANYISSLLCLGKAEEAQQYYNSLIEKSKVATQLLTDWSTEMKQCGIPTESFYKTLNLGD